MQVSSLLQLTQCLVSDYGEASATEMDPVMTQRVRNVIILL